MLEGFKNGQNYTNVMNELPPSQGIFNLVNLTPKVCLFCKNHRRQISRYESIFQCNPQEFSGTVYLRYCFSREAAQLNGQCVCLVSRGPRFKSRWQLFFNIVMHFMYSISSSLANKTLDTLHNVVSTYLPLHYLVVSKASQPVGTLAPLAVYSSRTVQIL